MKIYTANRSVVVAIDSFKGTIGARDAAIAIRDGWASVRPSDDVRLLPMADGGEGTLDAFAAAVQDAKRMAVTVTGPMDTTFTASWLLLPPTGDAPNGIAVVELAGTSGIELLDKQLRLKPLDTHTFGFGEAIAAALAHGVSQLVLGIGSSASTDGGGGMLRSLGARLSDANGRPIALGGRGLSSLATLDITSLPPAPPGGITVLTDVINPLLGPHGAAAVFGPQKGASARDVIYLERGLANLASQLRVDPDTPGAGAAGGTGFALLAWGARLVPGAEAVAELIGLPDAIAGASLVITGEGAFDGQSADGKVPCHVVALAQTENTPVALIGGRIDAEASTAAFSSCISLTDLAGSAERAMGDPHRWLIEAGAALARRHERAT